MSFNGCDVAWQKPSGAALQAAGYKVASLYVGQDNTGKNMTSAVVADYRAHDIAISTNFEYLAIQMLDGAPGGARDARLGWAQAQAAGVAVRMIYYSADWNVQAGEMPTVIAYLVGARSVTGPGTVGVYGSYAVVKAVHEYWQSHFPGEKVYLWQTIAWSNGQVYPGLDVYQDGSQPTVDGIQIDYDLILSDDAGQWPAPVEVDMTPDEHRMLVNVERIVSYMVRYADAAANGGDKAAYREIPGLDFLTGSLLTLLNPIPFLEDLIAKVAVAPATVDMTALNNLILAALTNPTVLKTETHAEAVELHNDLPAT